MKPIYILIFIFAFCKGYSQELWTLEKCINHAIENNIQIKTQELSLELNNNQLLQSKLSLLPSINASAGESLTFGRSVDPFTNEFAPENYNSTNFQFSSSITLFNGLRQYNSIKKAEINQKSGLLTLEK